MQQALDANQAEQLQRLLEAECEKLSVAAAADPHNYRTFAAWGELLLELSMLKEGEECLLILEKSMEKLNRALVLKPECAEAMTALGSAINMTAFRERDKGKALGMFQQAKNHFQRATEIDPSNPKYQQLLEAMDKAPDLYDHLMKMTNDAAMQQGGAAGRGGSAGGKSGSRSKRDTIIEWLGWGVFLVGGFALLAIASRRAAQQGL